MFQTINHKHGHINLTTVCNSSTITAWSHGVCIGDHYTTISGAKAAITRYHKKWLAEHYSKSASAK